MRNIRDGSVKLVKEWRNHGLEVGSGWVSVNVLAALDHLSPKQRTNGYSL